MANADRLAAQLTDYEERRAKKRFPVEQEVRYRALVGQQVRETGAGKTINISSGGVCFTTQKRLATGMAVELSITWPVLLRESCHLKLMVHGSVIRSSAEEAVLAIERYEFRTQGSHGVHQSLQGAQACEVPHGVGDRASN